MQSEMEFSIREAFARSWLIIKAGLPKFVLLTFVLLFAGYLNTLFEEHVSKNSVLYVKLAVGLPIFTFINIAIIYLTQQVHDNKADISMSELSKAAFYKTFTGSSMVIIAMIIFLLLLFLLIIPGIVWFVYVYFALQAIALKDVGIFASFRYSIKLVRGRFWQFFALFMLLEVLPEVATGINVPSPIHIVLFVLGTLFGIFSTVLSTVLFLNLDHLYGISDK